MNRLEALVHNLCVVRDRELFRTAHGGLFITGRRCLGIREIAARLFPDLFDKLVPDNRVSHYADVVYEAALTSDHDVVSAISAAYASQNIMPMLVEYPVGSSSLSVNFDGESVTPVGLVDVVGATIHGYTSIVEIKTAEIADAPRLQYLALFQVYGYSKLLRHASQQIKHVKMFVIAKSTTKLVMWRVKTVPKQSEFDRAFSIVIDH
jgi:hypothetical protein